VLWHSSAMGLSELVIDMSRGETRRTPGRVSIVLGCAFVVVVALTWTFLGMRSVMDVGGTCAEGGPYEIAQPCPNGALLLSAAIPALLIAAMLGSAFATLVGAPSLLVPMWGLLFGSLGWNFLEYGFEDGPIWGYIVPGVMFEAMALPAVVVIVAGRRFGMASRARDAEASPQLTWYLGYLILGVVGLVAGTWSFDSLS
jgi:hypothetical protein